MEYHIQFLITSFYSSLKLAFSLLFFYYKLLTIINYCYHFLPWVAKGSIIDFFIESINGKVTD